MIDLVLDGISKTYPPATPALDDIHLNVAAGECLAIVGPSGCGKTTLLRIIAGLEGPTTGSVTMDGADVARVAPHERSVAMLFQRPALVLNQTVRQNLGWAWTLQKPWRLKSLDQDEEMRRVARLLELDQVLERPVQQLSGGQQQRVALGRCLLRRAKILLLDEPLGHLDAPLRNDLRRQIRAVVKEQKLTTLYVTHDPDEAFASGDRVAVLQHGRVVQIDTSVALRRNPANRYVVELMHHHSGGLNWVTGAVVRAEMDTFFESALGRWPMPVGIVAGLRESLCAAENFHARQGKAYMILGVPIADVCCSTTPLRPDDQVNLDLPVAEIEIGSAMVRVTGADERGRWVSRATRDERLELGQVVQMSFSMARTYWFDAATGRTLVAPTG